MPELSMLLVFVAASAALLASSAAAFGVVKWVGVCYLVYLGLSRIFGRDEPPEEGRPAPRRSLYGIFSQGALVDALNPKVALFFLAFLPQFIRPDRGPARAQTLLLGLIYTAVALSTDSLYALLGGRVGGGGSVAGAGVELFVADSVTRPAASI